MKSRIPLPVARALGARLLEGLTAYPDLVTRVAVAGSTRREKPEVGDLEIVAIAARNYSVEAMRTVLERLHVTRGAPNKAGAAAPWGAKYYRGLAPVTDDLEVGIDLFVVTPPAEWGVVYLIRTGSAEFSQAVVTRLHRWGLKSEDGHIVNSTTGATLPCPNEGMFLRYARLPYLVPQVRDVESREFKAAFSKEWQPGEELRL